ncbi:Uncharacterised protein [Mycobacteroides abscessus subsp. abscessus]|nr:Uncharacterised protein [Mycobacteroides abscessus subsp. abscessus]
MTNTTPRSNNESRPMLNWGSSHISYAPYPYSTVGDGDVIPLRWTTESGTRVPSAASAHSRRST